MRRLLASAIASFASFGLVVGPGMAACRRETPHGATAAASASAACAPDGQGCGRLECRQYDSAAEAFGRVLRDAPRVVGVGEVHAPKGANVPSAAARFTDELLPVVAGRASDLLVELMMPPAKCLDAAAQVKAQQSVVTSRQAETNQNEYVAMGERARKLGIVPDMLRPSCADMDAIRDAGDEAIDLSLRTIGRVTGAQARRLVDRDEGSDADRGKMVLVYGGALHNDLEPPAATASYSYAPELDRYTHGRFVAVDLVVPEFIGDDDTWRSLPWWPSYDRRRLGRKVTLFRTDDRSFVLVFAMTAKTGTEEEGGRPSPEGHP
ncbi:MAG TPA: hypothetical protein VKU41_24545 [Polyangiaceae bacterium]|nr:hypothetical protein [Polyangiaceae bacterium]